MVELGVAAAALVLVVLLARELLFARRWRAMIDALHRLADVVDDLAVLVVDELEADELEAGGTDGPGDG